METNPFNQPAVPKSISLKIFGVGNAGVNVLEQVSKSSLPPAEFVAVNTDPNSLIASTVTEKICLEPKMMRGLGTGGDPERGRAVAEQNIAAFKSACEGVNVVFLVTGLGGGAGTGISPLLAKVAKEAGALVLAFATLPFDCEGNRRQRQAQEGLQELKAVADGVICLPNQKLFKLIDENTSVLDTFRLSNQLLAEGVSSVWRLIAGRGLIEIHFDELSGFLRDRHAESHFATAEAAGDTRSREVIDKLLAHPMLDGGKTLAESNAVLVSIIGGTDLSMSEINRVMEHINSKCAKAQVIMGAATDPHSQNRLAVTIIATRKSESLVARAGLNEAAHSEAAEESDELDTQLHRSSSRRPKSRFVPPPPAMSAENMEQLAGQQARGTGRGGRKARPKFLQTQLPLEIISKGRFDKSEPTIHKGEDLDVPTYIRRGVALN
jgi:cell division protein FtsZ